MDRGQVMLVVLIALAFIASIVMLFTDSDGALKIALLAALWAAIIGFFLVFRYRRDAEAARRELAHSTELHDAEVARAEAEREARMEARELRETQRSRDTAVLEDIQRELAGIRAQLENLAGREFEYEPAALRAEARRIRELESVTLDEPVESEVPEPDTTRPFGAPSPDAVAGRPCCRRAALRSRGTPGPAALPPAGQPPDGPHQGEAGRRDPEVRHRVLPGRVLGAGRGPSCRGGARGRREA